MKIKFVKSWKQLRAEKEKVSYWPIVIFFGLAILGSF